MECYSSESDTDSSDCTTHYADFTGELLNKKYLIICSIGEGSFATVWLGYNTKNNQYYAIKIQNDDANEYGEDEIDILNKLKSSKCKTINKMIESFTYERYDEYDEICEHVCMVFELLAGSIYDIMKIEKYKNGLSYKTTINILKQVVDALGVLYNDYKTIHTDIKPENILLCGVNNRIKKITDNFDKLNFNSIYNRCKRRANKNKKNKKNKNHKDPLSLACEEIMEKFNRLDFFDDDSDFDIDDVYMDENNIKVKLSDFGNCCTSNYNLYDIQTRHYRAPEIILEYPYNGKCDLWSLGCLVFELISGEVLFEPEKQLRVNKNKDQLHKMIAIFGDIPEYLLENADKTKIYYRTNGLLKNKQYMEYTSINYLLNNLTHLSDIEKSNISNIISGYCKYDPKKRDNYTHIIKI